MQDRVIYEYAVIRVVPKVEREEFINVGVIVFSKRKKYLDLKYVIDEQRLTSFAKDIDLQKIKTYLHAWKLVCKGGRGSGEIGEQDQAYRFRWLTAYRSSMLQSSRVHPGLCTHPEEVLEELFELYVL